MKSTITACLVGVIVFAALPAGATPGAIEAAQSPNPAAGTSQPGSHTSTGSAQEPAAYGDVVLGGFINLERWIWAGTGRTATMYASLASTGSGKRRA